MPSDLSIQVELLVRAHDCYTLGCSVDGISEVLLVVRQWVATLVSGKHFTLMVSLSLKLIQQICAPLSFTACPFSLVSVCVCNVYCV